VQIPKLKNNSRWIKSRHGHVGDNSKLNRRKTRRNYLRQMDRRQTIGKKNHLGTC
jgi:hypothetical protein